MSSLKASDFDLIRAITLEMPHRKTRQVDKLTAFLLKFKLFQDIRYRNGLLNFQDIAKNFTLKVYGFGEVIYKNSESRTFNYIIRGSVMLFSNKAVLACQNNGAEEEYYSDVQQQEHFYKKLSTDDYFGERLYVAHSCRITSAKATSHTQTIQMDLPTLYKTFYGYFLFKELEDKVAVLRNVVALKFLSLRKLYRILQMGVTKKVHNGYVLFKEDEYPINLMVILAGEVTLSKRAGDASRRNVSLCILPAFEVLGFTEIIRGDHYYSTAVCTRDRSEILSISKYLVKYMFDYQLQNELDVYRCKYDWRKTRAELINRTTNKYRETKSQTQPDIYANNKYLRMLTEPNYEIVEFGLEDRQKLFMTELESARKKRVVRRFLSLDKRKLDASAEHTQHCITSMGDQLYSKYMQRKCKKDMMLVYKYTNTHPPEMSDNPELYYTPVRPLYVHRSNAVKNTKRQLKASRRQLFEYLMSSSKSMLE